MNVLDTAIIACLGTFEDRSGRITLKIIGTNVINRFSSPFLHLPDNGDPIS